MSPGELRALAVELAVSLRERVLPALGAHAGRAHDSDAAGGDVTFAIDADAEAFLEAFLAEHAPGAAFFSEDRGLVAADGAEHVLVVDPIDGTRPLLGSGPEFQMSMLAAASHPLHRALVAEVDRGIARLRGLVGG